MHSTMTNFSLADEELVRRCQRELPHTTAAFETLVSRHTQRVYRLVYQVVHNKEEAEDLTQEVFLRVYRGLRGFDRQAAFTTWLYRIATNCALDALEKAQRRPQQLISLERARSRLRSQEQEEDDLARLASPTPQPDEQAMRNELRECINRVLRRLDRGQAQVLLLRDFEDTSYEEMTRILEIGLSSVKMRVHRARLAFQQYFGELCGKMSQVLAQVQRKRTEGEPS